MKLIVGLGNPGELYKDTRHNIGFKVLDNFSNKYDFKINKSKFGGLYCQTCIEGENIIFLKPQNYINLSGEVIKKYIDYFDIEVDDILIIHDDLDIPVGKYKLKASGSSGGHNGLKNIELNIGTKEYKRFKIGISNNKDIDTKDYVLGKFNDDEKEKIESIINISTDIIIDFLKLKFSDLMSKYNRK